MAKNNLWSCYQTIKRTKGTKNELEGKKKRISLERVVGVLSWIPSSWKDGLCFWRLAFQINISGTYVSTGVCGGTEVNLWLVSCFDGWARCIYLKNRQNLIPEFLREKDIDFPWLRASLGRLSWPGAMLRDCWEESGKHSNLAEDESKGRLINWWWEERFPCFNGIAGDRYPKMQRGRKKRRRERRWGGVVFKAPK